MFARGEGRLLNAIDIIRAAACNLLGCHEVRRTKHASVAVLHWQKSSRASAEVVSVLCVAAPDTAEQPSLLQPGAVGNCMVCPPLQHLRHNLILWLSSYAAAASGLRGAGGRGFQCNSPNSWPVTRS